ncbi:flagellar hook protein [Alteromonadaceae bacterium M269]|nr:flagellar hook protein [Alteromonadaceae bacterium M269]
MGIQSLGVGSGLALDDLVTQLLDAERAPREARIQEREDSLDAVISGIGQLQSRLSDFEDSVEAITRNFSDSTRTAVVDNPDDDDENPDTGAISAEASNSATRGIFEIEVSQLASGSRIETAAAADGGFSATTDTVLSAGTGSLTFSVGTENSFTINLSAGATLLDFRNAINDAEDNFGVNASIINTGTPDGGARLVFSSEITGAGNDLVINNDNAIAELDRVSNLTPVQSAQNAIATIDGIEVQSDTNEFENTIENVAFTANEVSPLSNDGINRETSTLNIGFDTDGFDSNIRDFVDNFNNLISEIDTLTRFGESELEEDGPLAGDFLPRNIIAGISNILSGAVESSELGTLFQVGVTFNDDGELEITDFDNIGLGSGEDRLESALEDNFDDIVSLFTDPDQGIGTLLEDFLSEFTRAGGLIPSRQTSLREERDLLFDERERLDLQLFNSEQILRDRFQNLDATVAQLNRTGSALFAVLG